MEEKQGFFSPLNPQILAKERKSAQQRQERHHKETSRKIIKKAEGWRLKFGSLSKKDSLGKRCCLSGPAVESSIAVEDAVENLVLYRVFVLH